MSTRLLEVCCADIESVRAAAAGGADRIELCSGLECGGLTPSIGLTEAAVSLMPGRVNVLIRPRGGDFLYTRAELDVIEADIRAAVAAGATGIVFGALTADGELDAPVLRRMIAASRPASFTLHRAFDVARDPIAALDTAISLGIDRILTSGCAPDALSGLDTLARLHQHAAGRIIILAGAGVTPANAATIADGSGVTELHASCKTAVTSGMRFRRAEVSMGTPGTDEYTRPATSQDIVHQLATILHR